MADLVAFCENPRCGAVFSAPNVFGGKGSAQITITNSRIGPCPRCGGSGLIPDGVYQYSNNVIRLLSAPHLSVEKLRVVETILRQAREQATDKKTILQQVQAASPDAAAALGAIPDQNSLLQWLAIVIALVSLAIQIHSTYVAGDDRELEKKFIEHLLTENQELTQAAPPKKHLPPRLDETIHVPAAVAKSSRNAACSKHEG